MKFVTVGYWRVSSDRQGRDGVSLDEQAAAGARWCREHDCELAQFIEDESAWTKRGARRPELQRALEYIRSQKGRVRYFLVYDLSRFARSMFHQLTIQRELAELGVQLTTVTPALEDNAHGRAIAGYLGVTNQLQSDLASEKIQGAMLEVVRRGRSPNRAPIGYLNARDAAGAKCVIPDPERAPLVRRAFELAAEGWTPTRIAEELERLGLRSRRQGVRIRQQEVRKMLSHRVYMGRVISFKHGLDTQGTHEPIVSPELFATVQRKLGKKDELSRAGDRMSSDFPLRGFLRCEACEHRITASLSRSHTGQRYGYYHCWFPGCKAVSARREVVEAQFREALVRLQLTPDEEAIARDHLAQLWRATRREATSARERLSKEAERLARRRDRVTQLLIDGTLDDAAYRLETSRLAAEQERVHFELAAAADPSEDLEALMRRATPMLVDTSRIWQGTPVAWKRRVQALIFPEGCILGSDGLRTSPSAPIFRAFRPDSLAEERMVEQAPSTSNLLDWFREAAAIVRVAA